MAEEKEVKRQKIQWSAEKVMSISALCVSLITLIALFYQLSLAREENELIRKQQSASVLPHIRPSFTFSPDLYKIGFINKGVGPAFFKKVEFSVDNNISFERSDFFVNHINKLIYEADSVSIPVSTYSFMAGDVLPANEELVILTIRDQEGITRFRSYLNSIDWSYTIIYEDVYGARWQLDSESDFPRKIEED